MNDYQLTEARNRLDAVIEAKDVKIAELQAELDKFPKTADGVTVTPGMTIWSIDFSGIINRGTYVGYDISGCPRLVFVIQDMSNQQSLSVAFKPVQLRLPLPHAFSTREAAEAANNEGKEASNA